MEQLGTVAFRLVVVLAVLLAMWLKLGKKQIGDLSPVDLAVTITAGTIAGAGIVDPRIDFAPVLAALLLLGFVHNMLSWLTLKSRVVHRKLNYQPTVLVENGQIIKSNLRHVRLTVEQLLQLLRERDVFDLTEVEVAILEPHGKLSVLKKPEYQPVTASQLNVTVPPNKILVPVIVEGKLQEDILRRMGFSDRQIDEFRRQHNDKLRDVFIAFMDKNQQMHIIQEDVEESGSFLH